ncbi:hypothetical protein J6590_014233 [Homalodisca vitripennis]|nr:hypothetical protein J6590_014233 [Homalodisca vitripennis]
MGECRGATAALGLGFNIIPPTESAHILNIWIWAFAVTSAVWIPASILLIVAAMGEVRGRTAAVLYRPWITLSGALIILDLAGGIFHLVNLFKTRQVSYQQGQTDNTAFFYLEVLKRLKCQIARFWPDIKDIFKVHHDNAPSYMAFVITNYLTQNKTLVVSQAEGKALGVGAEHPGEVPRFLRDIPVEDDQTVIMLFHKYCTRRGGLVCSQSTFLPASIRGYGEVAHRVGTFLSRNVPSWTGGGGTIYWPSQSPSLTLAFFVWGYFNDRTPDDFAEFVGSRSWQDLTKLSSSGVTTWLPSLFVTLLFTRVLIIWLLNIYLVYGVFRASSAVGLYTTKYVESPLTTTEKKKTWKDKFYQGPDPALFERPTRRSMVTTSSTANQQSPDIKPAETEQVRPRSLAESEPAKSEPASAPTHDLTHDLRHDLSPNRYREDEFGIPIEELDLTEPNETGNTQKKNTFPRSPYPPTGRVYDYTGRPVKPESVPDKWQDSPPPMASGVQVPPELNKFEPFSYMAGDQPQFIKRQLSRSSSRPEMPPLIPRPDYTIVDRRPASLEYIPNRFKVPSPKRPLPSQSSFNFEGGQRSPTTPKMAPVPPRKPMVYPRSSKPPISENPTQARYLPQQAVPSQQQTYFTRQTSQGNNYNINKLY